MSHFEAALADLGDQQRGLRIELQGQLATALHQSGRHRDAAAWYEKALSNSTGSPQLLNNFAFLLANDLDDPQR
ncbi:hypothetical protein, partial [Tritonibacter sp. SIMBA_163]|uniref:hypothetical protein n=1 Tax=Tritonibacter sp. SIMBA_163 TaxID=3080868 RepID=UPI00398087D3